MTRVCVFRVDVTFVTTDNCFHIEGLLENLRVRIKALAVSLILMYSRSELECRGVVVL